MTDTKPLAPTDAELDELRQANSGLLNFVTFREFRVIARAVLAKWGAPAPVRVEPLSDDRIAEMVRDTWGCASIAPRHAAPFARAVEAEVHKLYPAPQPVVREPLTPEQVVDAFCKQPHTVQFVEAFIKGVRFTERHHGIKGGQHGTDT